MAGTQNQLLKQKLFAPALFDDPDTIAQIANQETPALNQASGAVPKSFTDYAADPVNVAKIPEPVPANTPMPSVAAKALQPPPFSPDIQGAPDPLDVKPQSLFGEMPQAAPASQPQVSGPGIIGKAQPSLEDTLMDSPQAAAVTSNGPMSRADFLATLPGGHAPMPAAPPSYTGKKLAAMGLFTGLDSIGAALTHSEPVVGPGLIRSAQALNEYQRNLPATQATADNAAYEASLKQSGLVNAQTKTAVTIQGPNGPMTVMVDPATLKTLLPAQTRAAGTVQAAQIGAQGRMDVAQAQMAMQQGQISKLVPGINPQTGLPQYEAFNKAGKSLGFMDHSVVPSLMVKTSSTVDYKEDGDGVLHALPKTTISGPSLPGRAVAPQVAPSAAASRPAAVAAAPGQAAAISAPSSAAPANAGGPHATAGSIVPGFLGKAAKENGYAYDGNNQLVYTSRADASANGLTQFQKVSDADVNKDKSAIRMLNDVQANKSRYAQAASDYFKNGGDYGNDGPLIAKIISDNPLDVGFLHLPAADMLNKIENAKAYTALTPAGKTLVDGYYRAMAAVPAYQKSLTNIGRANKEMMDLELNNIPSPILGMDDIQRKLGAFQENIDRATEGFPRFKDMKQPSDIRAQYEPNIANKNNAVMPPPGAKIRDYTQLR